MATSTENFKFKKPDESDFYDIQDQNGNWDIADQELEKLNNPTFEDYTGDASVPAASAAIEELRSKSKLGVLLSNIKAAFKGACLIGHIVNNCVTDRSDLPLSAAQGKALMDLYNVLNTKNGINAPNTVFVTQDADEIRDSGIPGLYAFRVCGAGYLHDDIPSNDLYKYSFVLILYRNITSCHIILFPDGGEPVAVKSRVDQGWGGWRYLDYKL